MSSLATLIQQATGVAPLECYQCGCCSAGCEQNCPEAMDLSPQRLLHLIQMEHACQEQPELAASYSERILTSETIWLCLSCHACAQRCPQGIDLPAVMDALRQIALARGQVASSSRSKRIISSHQAFIETLKRSGRNNEVALVGKYKMRSGDLLSDINLAPSMLLKGKLTLNEVVTGALSVLPHRPNPEMQRILDAATALRQEPANSPDNNGVNTEQ